MRPAVVVGQLSREKGAAVLLDVARAMPSRTFCAVRATGSQPAAALLPLRPGSVPALARASGAGLRGAGLRATARVVRLHLAQVCTGRSARRAWDGRGSPI